MTGIGSNMHSTEAATTSTPSATAMKSVIVQTLTILSTANGMEITGIGIMGITVTKNMVTAAMKSMVINAQIFTGIVKAHSASVVFDLGNGLRCSHFSIRYLCPNVVRYK